MSCYLGTTHYLDISEGCPDSGLSIWHVHLKWREWTYGINGWFSGVSAVWFEVAFMLTHFSCREALLTFCRTYVNRKSRSFIRCSLLKNTTSAYASIPSEKTRILRPRRLINDIMWLANEMFRLYRQNTKEHHDTRFFCSEEQWEEENKY